jgi:glyoxylase-like metal-dependent hydrolase (beta-lactamase superfamily II)
VLQSWPEHGRCALEDGASVAEASAWTVINTPGHTDDSVAFWHNDSHTLLLGDAVITIRGPARFAPDTVDDVAALKTAARLRALPVEHLLPGHGLPIHALNCIVSEPPPSRVVEPASKRCSPTPRPAITWPVQRRSHAHKAGHRVSHIRPNPPEPLEYTESNMRLYR